MESNEEGVQYTQQQGKETITLKVRFSQFKKTAEVGGGSCLKWFNVVLSILLLVVGITCVIMGIICHVMYYEPFNYISSAYVNVVTVFIVAGIVMVVAGVLGIYCIMKKSYSSLMACLIIIAVLIILHFILGGLAFSYRSRADWLTKKAMIEGTAMYFDSNNAKKFMDWSQSKFKCCGYKGPSDYTVGTHSSTRAPQPTTHPANVTASPQIVNTTMSPTTKESTTTAALSETTTKAANTTVAVAETTTAAQNTTPNAVATTSQPSTSTAEATTTETPTTTAAETSTEPTTKNIVNDNAGHNFLAKKHGLPESCCKDTKSPEPCNKRVHDIQKHGCYKGVDSYLKEIMCAIGAISFVMIGFELLHLITGALCSKTIKEESSYGKV